MSETFIFVLSLLAIVGLCTVLGFIFRSSDDPNDNNVMYVLLKGLGILGAIAGVLLVICTVVGLFMLIFS